MFAIDQPKTTYSDTIPQKKAVTDMIDIIDPDKVPVVKYFGLDGSPGEHRIVNWPETKVEWLEDQLAPIDSTFNSGGTTTINTKAASATYKITVADGSLIKTGDVLLTEGTGGTEVVVLVDSVSGSNATLRTAGWEGSATKAVIASKGDFDIIGNARDEGADADYERALTSVSSGFNHTQIWQEDLKITETQQVIQQYGIASEWDYQIGKQLPHLLRMMERSFFRGVRLAGSGSTPRAMGGLEQYLSTNTVTLSGSNLTKKDVDDLMQSVWESGGQPNLLICNAGVKRWISAMFEGYVRTTRDETRGGVRIDTIETEFGDLDILMSMWCPVDRLYLLETEYIGFLPLRTFEARKLAKTGDSIKGELVGEYTLVVRNEQAHGMIKSISTTS